MSVDIGLSDTGMKNSVVLTGVTLTINRIRDPDRHLLPGIPPVGSAFEYDFVSHLAFLVFVGADDGKSSLA